MRAYSEMYLQDGMWCIADMLEYGVNECGIEPEKLFDMFIGLGYADAFGNGSLKYVAGMSGIELAQRIIDEGLLETHPESNSVYPDIYWCGWILAYYQWRTAMPFRDIIKYITFDYLHQAYPALHTANEEKAAEVFSKIIKREQRVARIKTARENYGCSQRKLAEMADVNIRTLQEYENKRRDINRASGSVLMRLSRALCCNIEDILEYEI